MTTPMHRVSDCIRTFASTCLVVGLGGCGSAAPAQPQTAQQQARAHEREYQPDFPETPQRQTAEVERCVPHASVHFGFDSTDIDSAERDKLVAAASCLRQGTEKRVTITGMTDPRGTEEYNLALGERRAQVTAGYVTSMGVEPERIGKRSYGEEYARGQDESGWSNDRRAEINVE